MFVRMALLVCYLIPFSTDGLQTKTRTTTTNMYQFMSKMFSMLPANATRDLLRGVQEGDLHKGANLGYEPYWSNVPDLPLYDKCKLCSMEFQQYKTVCAVDDTGDMYVNMSLCGMLRQNCLNGHAVGKLNYQDWGFKEYYVVSDGWARVSVRMARDFIIRLSNTPSRIPPFYEIHLEPASGWFRGTNGLYRDYEWYPRSDIYNYYYDYEYRQYRWIYALNSGVDTEIIMHWNYTSGWILITKSSYENWTRGFHLNYTDPNPFHIKYISFGSDGDHHTSGNWTVEDLATGMMVTSINPCPPPWAGGEVLPVTQVTNPTAIPVVDQIYSKAVPGYRSRMKAEGLEGLYEDKLQGWGTREEY